MKNKRIGAVSAAMIDKAIPKPWIQDDGTWTIDQIKEVLDTKDSVGGTSNE